MRSCSCVNSNWTLRSFYNTALDIPDLLALSSRILRTLSRTRYPTASSSR
ncbi:hypothetical protein M422DRAFT_30737 [Sphaerobolus stellatus SS14]|uniref:Uncharacterized protein n=1 Tax=Sphaerobolus stellatus (strain SS14) TaxID=990650 RepID=A0A0C9ULQ3_SPHS4|nr:hypothetical protein M422DRAFT_30737 [Sphaerobolus stellatus SS14]